MHLEIAVELLPSRMFPCPVCLYLLKGVRETRCVRSFEQDTPGSLYSIGKKILVTSSYCHRGYPFGHGAYCAGVQDFTAAFNPIQSILDQDNAVWKGGSPALGLRCAAGRHSDTADTVLSVLARHLVSHVLYA